MPVLTEEELQKLKDKASLAEKNLKNSQAQHKKLQDKVEEANSKKKSFIAAFIICLILLVLSLGIFFMSPETFGLEQGTAVVEDEMVVKKSDIENYQKSITELEQELENQKVNHPLNLNEFYAVQLGAFKKFNTKLSSDSFSIVRNADYQDFNLYTLGVFETEEEAENLRKIVRQLNFRDAFVGKYENGERVDANFK